MEIRYVHLLNIRENKWLNSGSAEASEPDLPESDML